MQARREPLGSERQHLLHHGTQLSRKHASTATSHSASRNRCRILLAFCVSLCLFLNVGCEGCLPEFLTRKDKEGEENEREKPEKLEPYESKELDVLPTDDSTALQYVKPGHWFSVQQELKSNKADFYGQLDCISSNRAKEPLPLRHSNFRLRTKRVVSLPKGQAKSFELTFFAPTTYGRSQQIFLHSDLRPSYSGTIQWPQSQLASKLRPHQTYLVVLARRPDSYGFLKTLESIKPPTQGMFLTGTSSDYVVVLPDSTRKIPLPSWPLMWTMISYIVWDDFDAGVLTPSQQRALVDWLHWGGQLIVSGPNSLDSMNSSFLKDYLPGKAVATRKITDNDVETLNSTWAFTKDRINKKVQLLIQLNPDAAPEMIEMELAEDANFIPGAGKLLAERRIGRGRIVASAFSLPSREFANWDGFDNLFNACVMRRPPRRFSESVEMGTNVVWTTGIGGLARRQSNTPKWEDVPPSGARVGNFRPNLPDDAPSRFPIESLLNSKLRYFSRDASFSSASDSGDRKFHLGIGGYSYGQQSGVAGWSDFSDCSVAARQCLTEAAGISVPDRHFILVTLGLYLFILVPANWTIFRAIGRVEWAWVAVPIIAMVGTYFVVRLAQLDIGFARSRTEIAVIETQPSYQRAHLTRYTGLYTSLSTSYSLSFANDSALSLPFAALSAKERLPDRQSPQTVDLDRVDKKGTEIRLDRFAVSSNSTEMVHSEEMFDLGGAVRLAETAPGFFRVENQSDYDYQDVGVIRSDGGRIQTAWVGEFNSKANVALKFKNVNFSAEKPIFAEWQTAFENEEDKDIGLNKFLELGLNPTRLHDGDIRLVGWTDVEMPGLTIEPAASQRYFRTVIVSNLRYGALPAPESDANPASDFRTYQVEPQDEEKPEDALPQ